MWTLDCEFFFRDGMDEDQFGVVERKARSFLTGAIFGVAHNGMADVGKLGADLVVAAGVEGDLDEGGVG